MVTDSKKNYSLRTLIDSHRSNIHLTLFMSQKLVVASVPISITVFSLGFITIRKTGLRIACRVVHIIFLSYLFLLFSCFTMQSKRFLFSQTQSGIVLMKYDDIVVNVLPAPFPGFFEVRVFVQMAYLNVLSYRFNMPKKNKSVTFLKIFFNLFSAASRFCFRGLFSCTVNMPKKNKKKKFFLQVFFLGFLLAIFFRSSSICLDNKKAESYLFTFIYRNTKPGCEFRSQVLRLSPILLNQLILKHFLFDMRNIILF